LIIGNFLTLVGGVGSWNTDGAITSVQPGRRTSILDPSEVFTGVDPAVLYSVFWYLCVVTTKIWPLSNTFNKTALDIVKTDIEEMSIPLLELVPDIGA
jgi:hypothetical protein